ncbi:hypothetical protein EHM69_03445 [candidate division KSB1 bacterium]|nr:MAG: hypothetical protein EHM69_03445 [candidate division KSB1 bacterium]
MTSKPTLMRAAHQTADGLRGVLQQLFALSLAQVDALEREDYRELERLIAAKAPLLQALPALLKSAEECGWKLYDPATFPADKSCAALLTEAADFSRRLQAHEKFVLGQVLARKAQMGERLSALACKRNAAAGYREPMNQGSMIDTAR